MLIKGKNFSLDGIKKILLIQLGDIGDVVLTTPAIKALRQHFPQANIIVAVREKAKELIEDCSWVSGVISINKEKRRFSRKIAYQKDFFLCLRKYKFDMTIDMRTGTRGAILSFLSGANRRIGFYADNGELWRNRVFTHLILLGYTPGQYVAQYYSSLLHTLNIKTHMNPLLEVSPEKRRKAAALFRNEKVPPDRPVIAIHPFSLWKYKEWGMDKYVQLMNWIGSEYKLPIIITGSPDERERAVTLKKMCGKHVYNFAGKTSIAMLGAVLDACGLFIGVDSAGMHIAGAVGTPTISIFGPSSPASWAPRGKQHTVVYKDLPCVPCRQKGCDNSEVSRCLDELSVKEVISAVDKKILKIRSIVQ